MCGGEMSLCYGMNYYDYEGRPFYLVVTKRQFLRDLEKIHVINLGSKLCVVCDVWESETFAHTL